MKNKLMIITIIVIAVVGALGIYYFFKEDNSNIKVTNSFHKEYTLVGEDNVFVYKNIDEVITLLESGTGVLFLGFPECPWCQHYVKYLNEVAKSNKYKEIYYFNIKNDRYSNTVKYQKIVSLLGEKLLNDDAGNKRVFVPDVTFVKDGKIIGHDNETSVINIDIAPTDYWTTEKENALKLKLNEYFSLLTGACATCN